MMQTWGMSSMEGVTILNEVNINSKPFFILILALILIIIACVTFVSFDDFYWMDNIIGCIITLLIGCTIFVIVAFVGFKNIKEMTSYKTYEVLCDDTVNINEFYAKYKVIDKKGLIYTVKER